MSAASGAGVPAARSAPAGASGDEAPSFSAASRAVLDDLHAVTALTKQLYPGVPYFLLGHSMGSFYARQYLCE